MQRCLKSGSVDHAKPTWRWEQNSLWCNLGITQLNIKDFHTLISGEGEANIQKKKCCGSDGFAPVLWVTVLISLQIICCFRQGVKPKVHAQRKFAQGSRPGSPNISPVKKKTTPKKFFTTKKAKTEDFLTFLCLRGRTYKIFKLMAHLSCI